MVQRRQTRKLPNRLSLGPATIVMQLSNPYLIDSNSPSRYCTVTPRGSANPTGSFGSPGSSFAAIPPMVPPLPRFRWSLFYVSTALTFSLRRKCYGRKLLCKNGQPTAQINQVIIRTQLERRNKLAKIIRNKKSGAS